MKEEKIICSHHKICNSIFQLSRQLVGGGANLYGPLKSGEII